jgi:coenzyme F420-0:L-glutamate ligase
VKGLKVVFLMEAFAIKTPIVQVGDDLFKIFTQNFDGRLEEGDVISVASKIVSMSQGRIVRLTDVTPSQAALSMKKKKYSKDFDTYPELAELVIREADQIFEGGLICLTLKNNIFIPSAGIDLSNAPKGYAILWPDNPWNWAKEFREKLKKHYDVHKLGTLIADSHCTPLRMGVSGLALAYSGFEGVQDERGKKDLFGKPLVVTQKAVADDLASVAILLTGESGECTPFVVIRAAPIQFTEREINPMETVINPTDDLFAGIYNEEFKAGARSA